MLLDQVTGSHMTRAFVFQRRMVIILTHLGSHRAAVKEPAARQRIDRLRYAPLDIRDLALESWIRDGYGR